MKRLVPFTTLAVLLALFSPPPAPRPPRGMAQAPARPKARSIPLKEIHSTRAHDDLQEIASGKSLDVKVGNQRKLWMVRGAEIDDAMKRSKDAFTGTALEQVLPDGKPAQEDDQYWVGLSMGTTWIGPIQWFVESFEVEDKRVRIDVRKTRARSVSFIEVPYLYWVPIGRLKSGTYLLELYDDDKSVVSLAQRVQVSK